ncbi:ImmA/IrrE family metallo-endopeptidase [Alkalibacillus almallahensis]|uniref:ImmA/IrrE family metallo-endopeptidase n=1 Tax=Alkalibacillus almallahensis TaxID=1379154 RepID=UPI0014204BBD|nr:ImmA/IrrE family metallo-endopeptidase [Alkalibacillus almallahensis]NIK12831.1 protein-tyrosine-phosphatase [Alkalibacillus almallahensis]
MINYQTTALEDFVTNIYLRHKIMRPQDLDIDRIGRIFYIHTNRKPMPPRFDVIVRYRGIIVDSREPKSIQREQFFHELCHILRHAGHQSLMPRAFRELQEQDAQAFAMYAALPYHMLQHFDFSDPYIIGILAETFCIRQSLVYDRLNQIYRNQKSTLLTAENGLSYR